MSKILLVLLGETRFVIVRGGIFLGAERRFLKKLSRRYNERTQSLKLLRVGATLYPPQRSIDSYSAFFLKSPHAMAISTIDDNRCVAVNDAWLKLNGCRRQQVLGRSINEFMVGERKQKLSASLIEQYFPCSSNFLTDECWIVTGHNGIMLWTILLYRDEFSAAGYLIHSAIDITRQLDKDIHQLKNANEALRLSEDKFSKAFNTSPAPMCIASIKDGLILNANESFCRLAGYTMEEIMGNKVYDLDIWVDIALRSRVIKRLADGEVIRDLEASFRRKSGEHRVGLFSFANIDIDGETCLLIFLTDITEKKQAEAEISYLSFHDKLTGIYNRAFFEEELKRLDTERQLPISLIMGDVNGLKLINDALGHQEGDKLLTTVAATLKEACRYEDIVARWGGDEFIILLPVCSSKDAARIIERIKRSETVLHKLPIQTSISLGMATKTRMTEDIREIIKDAEDKMYRNKLLENRSTRSYFLSSLEKTLWTRSHETREHCERIEKMALQIAKSVRLPESEIDSLKLLAALHDIGKIAIPTSILDKSGKLNPEEWETMKKHPEIGYRIALSSPEMSPIAEAILHHHERWDGGGYPLGLRGKDIPFLSRIIAIADAYDVMVHGRPYQKAISPEEAWSEIQNCSGTHFDPELVKKFSTIHFE